jgi:hypothetical protein
MMPIVPVGERDQEPGVGDAFHEREKPFREERSFEPRTEPASRMNA